VILGLLAGVLAAAAAAAPVPGTALESVDADTAAWTAYQRIHSDFFDIDKVPAADPREVELGRELFFDPRLSGNGAMSCWSCHDPSRGWGDGLPRARGIGHKLLARNTTSLLTTHRNIPFPLFWDGRAKDLTDAVRLSLLDPDVMGTDARSLTRAFDRVPSYARRMTELYGPAGVSVESACRALAAFIRTQVVPRGSPFDRYPSDPSALSPAAKRGMVVYAGKGRCLLCHTGAYFSDDFWHNVGLRPTPGLEDRGRGEFVPEKHAVGAFHTPTLRDVARTAPYMHDGSERTLRDVVEFYNRGGDRRDGSQDDLVVPLGLSEREKADLVVFLEALSSPDAEAALPVLPPVFAAETPGEAYAEAAARLGAAARAAALRRPELAAAHAASAREALAQWRARGGGDCVAAADRAAAALEAASDAGRAGLAAPAAAARRALAACAPPPEPGDAGAEAPPPPSALVAAADGSIAEARRLLSEAEAIAPRPDGAVPDPLPGFDIPRFLSALAGGRWSPANTEVLEQAVRADVMRYYEYKTFLADDPAACAEIKIHKIYFGVNRTGEWACRERHYENELSHALIVRPPDFDRRCRESMAAGYPELEIRDVAGACVVLRENLERPGPCGPLIAAGYLQEDKRVSCDNFFARIYGLDDEAVCGTLDGGPTAWRDRCRALSAFARAHKARDPKLCLGRGLCLAFMGVRAGSVDEAAEKIESLARNALRKGWQDETRPRVEKAFALAADARARLSAAESERDEADRALAAEVDAREEALARVVERAQRLRAAAPSQAPSRGGPG
jgi:cytochrome c peroxidase